MITVEQYAKKNKVSENSARKRLQRKVLEGYMFKMRGPDNRFVYHDKPLVTIKWHDPFNKCRAEFNSFNGDKWPLMPRIMK
jgi:hypothetical protein